jgi:hypothetical protein
MRSKLTLNKQAEDLWYTLHEDYFSKEQLYEDFENYLDAEIEILQQMSDEERCNCSSDIKMDYTCGRNVAYTIMTAIGGCQESFPDKIQPHLNKLLAAVNRAFSKPTFPEYWDAFYLAADDFSRNL